MPTIASGMFRINLKYRKCLLYWKSGDNEKGREIAFTITDEEDREELKTIGRDMRSRRRAFHDERDRAAEEQFDVNSV